MPSSPLGSTHGRTTSRMAWHHRPWIVHTVRNVGRGITSPPLVSTHNRMTSGVACHHCHWTAHTVERRRAWHAIIALGSQTRSNDVRRGMPSSPLGSTNGRTTSGMACHHLLWAAKTVERRWAWHAIIALGRQTRSNDVRRDMPSPPLDSTHGRTTSCIACHYCLWVAHTVEQRHACMPSSPLGSTHGRTTSGVA